MKRLKLTKDVLRLRYSVAKDDFDFLRDNKRKFNMDDAAKLFGISKQTFWHYISTSEKHKNKFPSKECCSFCGKSQYDRFSDWVNDGSLDHIIKWKGVK